MEKNGEVQAGVSLSDFDGAKKAEFYDEDGFGIADAANKDKLAKPVPIEKLSEEKE